MLKIFRYFINVKVKFLTFFSQCHPRLGHQLGDHRSHAAQSTPDLSVKCTPLLLSSLQSSSLSFEMIHFFQVNILSVGKAVHQRRRLSNC